MSELASGGRPLPPLVPNVHRVKSRAGPVDGTRPVGFETFDGDDLERLRKIGDAAKMALDEDELGIEPERLLRSIVALVDESSDGDASERLGKIAETARMALEQTGPGSDAARLLQRMLPRDELRSTPWRLQSSRPCVACSATRSRDDFSGNQWKRPTSAVCKDCVSARLAHKGNPEYQPGGSNYVPGVKASRNKRRQAAARSLPKRPGGETPSVDDPDVRALAASYGAKERAAQRRRESESEAQARNAALSSFDFLDDGGI